MQCKYWALLLAASIPGAVALDMDTNSKDSIHDGLSKIARGIMDYYTGHQYGNAIGMFEPPYYWWQSGAAWGSLLDYWYFTGDTTYNGNVYDSLLWQAGDNFDYIPENQTMTEGNDDQGYWGITLMGAAERGFQDPEAGTPSWSKRVENIVDSMITRWDTTQCGGGLRWQIYPWNKGYDYKNTVSNGCLFHLSARLSRFNGHDKYIEWAEKSWNWMEEHDFILTNTSDWKIFDGASVTTDCRELSIQQWTYNAGLLLSGAAYMYDYTKDSKWLDRAKHIWAGCDVFFKDSTTMYEAACQISGRCNNDQRSFKAYFSRFLGLTSMLLPELSDSIMTQLHSTVPGVLSSCSGGSDGNTCGLDWSNGTWDGLYGLGEQMSSLELLQNALLSHSKPGPALEGTESALESFMSNGGTGTFSAPAATSASPEASTASSIIISAIFSVESPAVVSSTSVPADTHSSTQPAEPPSTTQPTELSPTTQSTEPPKSTEPAPAPSTQSAEPSPASASAPQSAELVPVPTTQSAEPAPSSQSTELAPAPSTQSAEPAPAPSTQSSVPAPASTTQSVESGPSSQSTEPAPVVIQPSSEPLFTIQTSPPIPVNKPTGFAPVSFSVESAVTSQAQVPVSSVVQDQTTPAATVPTVTVVQSENLVSTATVIVTATAKNTITSTVWEQHYSYHTSTALVVVTVYSTAPDSTVTVYTDDAGSVVATATNSNFSPPTITAASKTNGGLHKRDDSADTVADAIVQREIFESSAPATTLQYSVWDSASSGVGLHPISTTSTVLDSATVDSAALQDAQAILPDTNTVTATATNHNLAQPTTMAVSVKNFY